MTFKELVKLFLDTKTNKKGKNIKENTKIAYMMNLNKLKVFLNENNLSYEELKPYHLDLFINQQREKKYSDATIYQLICNIKCFFEFLFDNDFMTKNISKKLKAIPPENETDIYLDEVEVKLLLTYLKDHEKWNNIRLFDFRKKRDLFFFTLILKHGYRVEEALTLTEDNFNFDNRIITVFGDNRKNGKDVVNRLDDELLALYRDCVAERNKRPVKDNYIFLSKSGVKISSKDANKILQERIHEANMYFEMNKDKYKDIEIKDIRDKKDGICMHKLRHTASYLMSKNGYTLQEVGKVLGQKSIMVTCRYTHVNLNDLDKKNFSLLG